MMTRKIAGVVGEMAKMTPARFLRGAVSRRAATADDGSYLEIRRAGRSFYACVYDASVRQKTERKSCQKIDGSIKARVALFKRNYR